MPEEEPLHPEIVPCKYCGKNIPVTTTFCWYCGRELIARPERPDVEPAFKVGNIPLLITFILVAVFVAFMLWSIYPR
ncbi:MAG: hypothetical protein LWX83_06540 [Anaerolineae bacterium]|nr:hypothetical protein [Anaerolineae bacterium]